jgi:hypothetical protein
MIRDHLRSLARVRRSAFVLAIASMLVLAFVGLALADTPKEFEVFKQCPTKNPEVNLCFYIQSKGGLFTIGNKKVPVNKTITLQGGSIVNETTGAETFVAPENGETLSKTPLTVPGGLFGLKAPESWPPEAQEWFNKHINEGFTGVTATAELVGTPGISRANLLSAEGVALSLPVRLHLNNVILGSECYLGSAKNPVTFELTSGTTKPPAPNEPISGTVGELKFNEAFTKVTITGNKVVDNSFAAPGTEGCGGAFAKVINPFVEKLFGVPAAAGHNTAILEGTLENGLAKAVVEAGF